MPSSPNPNHFVFRPSCLSSLQPCPSQKRNSNKLHKVAHRKERILPRPTRPQRLVLTMVDDTPSNFYERVEGRSTGQAILASNLDLGAFSRDKDVQFVIVNTANILRSSTPPDYTSNCLLADFPGQIDKTRGVIVILHRGHVDLFALRNQEQTQVVICPWKRI